MNERTPAQIEGRNGWISVNDRLPRPGIAVNVAVTVKGARSGERIQFVLRAQYAAEHTLESSDDDAQDPDSYAYDEESDTYWCVPGWYEDNQFEDTHWRVDGSVTHWQPLPVPPDLQQMEVG